MILLVVYATPVFAARLYPEKDYQQAWCGDNRGVLEVRLPDLARVDCVTKTHAVEFDFADKWGEAIGQALYYGTALNKQPGIVLIMENPEKDRRYLNRVMAVAKDYNIEVWTIGPDYIMRKITQSKNNANQLY